MLKNYLKIALRIITRYKSYSFINIGGLAVGMAAFILIALYIRFELSYDKFNENIDRIYRLEELWKTDRGYGNIPITPAPLAPLLTQDYPEIVNSVRIIKIGRRLLPNLAESKKLYQMDGKYVDPSIFDIFTFPFIKGNPKTALVEPFSMVLTDELAEKYFPHEEPMGKIIRIKDQFDCRVTGVVKKPPHHSHLKFSYLVSLSSYERAAGSSGSKALEDWELDFLYSYILFQKKYSSQQVKEVEAKIRDLIKRHRKGDENIELYLRPLSDIHLHSNTNYEIESSTPIEIVFMFVAIGIFILLIACINFMNLSTAYSSTRTKEVGIRKVLGAARVSLIKQFLSESILLTFISGAVALVLAGFFMSEFNILLDTKLQINFVENWMLIIVLIFILFLVGIISGIYPAFLLSSFQPVKVLKGKLKSGAKRSILRKILITSQFLLCIVFIIGSIVIYKQGNYLKHMDKGYEEEHIFTQIFSNLKKESIEKFNLLKNELLKNPAIVNVTISSDLPYAIYSRTQVNWQEGGVNQKIWVTYTCVDNDFIDTYGLKLKDGRTFSKAFSTDQGNACIINETALKRFGWDSSPLGKRIADNKYTVIGVIKDFLSSDLRLGVQPLMLIPLEDDQVKAFNFSIKIAPGTESESFTFIKRKFEEFLPDELLELRLFKDIMAETFTSLDNWNKLFAYFSILSIIIASLGLYALAAFTTKQRTKEIGIRKIVGASVSKISFILVKEFFKILTFAILIAWPAAYFLMNGFLQNFVYRIHLNAWIFIGAGVIVLWVSAVTVVYHTIKAALANPVESLRYE